MQDVLLIFFFFFGLLSVFFLKNTKKFGRPNSTLIDVELLVVYTYNMLFLFLFVNIPTMPKTVVSEYIFDNNGLPTILHKNRFLEGSKRLVKFRFKILYYSKGLWLVHIIKCIKTCINETQFLRRILMKKRVFYDSANFILFLRNFPLYWFIFPSTTCCPQGLFQ